MDAKKLIFAARGRLLQTDPFFGGLSMELSPEEAPGLNTIGVAANGAMIYDPEWVAKVVRENGGTQGGNDGLDVLQTILAHEVLHAALGHCSDMLDIVDEDMNNIGKPDLFNMAADVVVNSWLLAAGFNFPRTFSEPLLGSSLGICERDENSKVHENMSAMEIYFLLLREAQENADNEGEGQPGGDQGSGSGSGGNGEGDGEGGDGNGLGKIKKAIEDMVKDAQGNGEGMNSDISRDEPKGGSGDSVEDKVDQHKNQGSNGNNEGKGNEGKGKTASREQMREEWQNKLMTAAATAALSETGQGSMPGWLKRNLGLAEDVKHEVPWERVLTQAVASENVRSFARPARRHIWRGQILPGATPNIRKAVVIIDTSGSVGQRELNTFRSAMDGMVRTGMVRVLATISADARVQNVQKGLPRKGQENFAGGGGTDFRPALAEARKFHPDVVVYLTDGWGLNFRTRPQGMGKVIWVLTPYGETQPWGINVKINYR